MYGSVRIWDIRSLYQNGVVQPKTVSLKARSLSRHAVLLDKRVAAYRNGSHAFAGAAFHLISDMPLTYYSPCRANCPAYQIMCGAWPLREQPASLVGRRRSVPLPTVSYSPSCYVVLLTVTPLIICLYRSWLTRVGRYKAV